MAHSFYHSKRPRWVCILTWGISFLFCGTAAALLKASGWFSGIVYERISMHVGFSGIAVYLYLFPEIPVGQRIFTYFFVDNLMYILVTLARYSSVYLLNWLNVPADWMFLAVYAAIASGTMYLFAVYFKDRMLRLLRKIEGEMNGFAAYAGLNYMVTIAFVDPWAPMNPLTVWQVLRVIMICAVTICVYYVAFRALDAIGKSESVVPMRYCGCYGANVLLNYYAGEAVKEGILFECDAAVPKCGAEDSTALCIVLGNALQNAMEAHHGFLSTTYHENTFRIQIVMKMEFE